MWRDIAFFFSLLVNKTISHQKQLPPTPPPLLVSSGCSILERSKVLRKDGAGEWILVDDGYVVHGGDACDKGKKKKKNMKKTMRSLLKKSFIYFFLPKGHRWRLASEAFWFCAPPPLTSVPLPLLACMEVVPNQKQKKVLHDFIIFFLSYNNFSLLFLFTLAYLSLNLRALLCIRYRLIQHLHEWRFRGYTYHQVINKVKETSKLERARKSSHTPLLILNPFSLFY